MYADEGVFFTRSSKGSGNTTPHIYTPVIIIIPFPDPPPALGCIPFRFWTFVKTHSHCTMYNCITYTYAYTHIQIYIYIYYITRRLLLLYLLSAVCLSFVDRPTTKSFYSAKFQIND